MEYWRTKAYRRKARADAGRAARRRERNYLRRVERDRIAEASLLAEANERVPKPRLPAAEWTITVRHRDGSRATLRSYIGPSGRLTMSATEVAKRIQVAMVNYRP